MSFKAQYLPYQQTGAFNRIVTDYIEGATALQPFYSYRPDLDGIKKAIAAKNFTADKRKVLVEELQKQYLGINTPGKVSDNILLLQKSNTFCVCTAHQPNIFTGHLYFIYKIIHVIKLADELSGAIPETNFVPVFYMGSEDADLEELGEVHINGKKYQWTTKQKGAVGRMLVDKDFIALIDGLEGQLSVAPFGNEIIGLVKKSYTLGKSIEQATLEFINELFSGYGLIVLLPDNPRLKTAFNSIVEKELAEQFSSKAVEETINLFPKEYKAQVAGRPVNLFYLKDDIRERIEQTTKGFTVAETSIKFSPNEIANELAAFPERFSPNVILRPLYQETILPNIAFIGGGSELAYWLELKKLFEIAAVPFPVLVLRNSFMIIDKKTEAMITGIHLTAPDLFRSGEELLNNLVKKETQNLLHFQKERSALSGIYDTIIAVATAVDPTLSKHVVALSKQTEKRILQLEKKMLKAERKRFEAQQRHINKIKSKLFPARTLQERVDNLLPYYAVYGPAFISELYQHSTGLKQEFCVLLSEK